MFGLSPGRHVARAAVSAGHDRMSPGRGWGAEVGRTQQLACFAASENLEDDITLPWI